MTLEEYQDSANKVTLKKIIETYGVSAQVDMAIEEMSELTKALLKNRRSGGDSAKLRDDIIEEIADVTIMIEQLTMIFDCEAEVKQQIIYKLTRQLKRMKQEGGKI